MLNTHGHKENLMYNNALLCLVSLVSISWTGLAPYKLPRALDSLLIYQQPSSTTLYCSYQEYLFLTKARLRNETGEYYRRINIKSCSSEQGVWSPQTPARCIILHYDRREECV